MAELESAAGGEATGRTPLRSPSLTETCVLVCFSAWARVELTVEPSVEVFLGESATLTCQHTFKDITRPPRLVMTQWFVVSRSSGAQQGAGEGV